MNPIIDNITPIKTDILKGITENAVNPFIQSPSNLPKVYPDEPTFLSL